MTLHRLRRPAHAWIAVLALLFNAFVPANAHRADPLAVAVGGAGTCTADRRSPDATKMVDSETPPRSGTCGNGACPFCLLDGGSALPPSRGPDFLAVGNVATVPVAPATGEWPAASAWPAAQPRAPPP